MSRGRADSAVLARRPAHGADGALGTVVWQYHKGCVSIPLARPKRRRHVLGVLFRAVGGSPPSASRARPGARHFPETRLAVPAGGAVSGWGGTSDRRARQVAERLWQDVGWTVAADIRPGASGMIGSDRVAKAPADGYTLLLRPIGTRAISPALFPNQAYNVLYDVQPVTQFCSRVWANRLPCHFLMPRKPLQRRAGVAVAIRPGGSRTENCAFSSPIAWRARLSPN